MTVHVEIADFTRFPMAKAFMAYVGLTSSESSSGEKISRISITKQGNSAVRSMLVECANALVKGTIGLKSKRVKARQTGKPRNVAITVIARELGCFILGLETGEIYRK
ncbi:transposase [Bacillus thuringiensis]|uniref:transposase n=1 Tax=Bacillus sp. AF62 TaxID=3158960 RepID=UPI001F54A0DE|nr:transposase [Bacillus thuringiensis]MED3391818.1 transposase [Bacillus thuringiensis]